MAALRGIVVRARAGLGRRASVRAAAKLLERAHASGGGKWARGVGTCSSGTRRWGGQQMPKVSKHQKLQNSSVSVRLLTITRGASPANAVRPDTCRGTTADHLASPSLCSSDRTQTRTNAGGQLRAPDCARRYAPHEHSLKLARTARPPAPHRPRTRECAQHARFNRLGATNAPLPSHGIRAYSRQRAQLAHRNTEPHTPTHTHTHAHAHIHTGTHTQAHTHARTHTDANPNAITHNHTGTHTHTHAHTPVTAVDCDIDPSALLTSLPVDMCPREPPPVPTAHAHTVRRNPTIYKHIHKSNQICLFHMSNPQQAARAVGASNKSHTVSIGCI